MTYSEKLEDPRWIVKRDLIKDRDGNKCMLCKSHAPYTFLEVHHIKYTGEPWDAPDNDLITLCSDCHKMVEHGKLHGVNPSFDQILKKHYMQDYVSYLQIRLAKALNTIKFQQVKMYNIIEIEHKYACELKLKITEIETNNDYN